MNKINVVFVADVNAIDACIISMLSVLKNKKDKDFINFYFIFDEFFKDIHFEKFECLKTNSSNIFFKRVFSTNYVTLRNSTLRMDLPCNAYYRLSIADLIPDEDKAIYLDFDTYTCSSLSDLFNIDINDYYLGAVRDIWEFQRKTELEQVGIKTVFHYNSGMMLLNLKKWRRDNVFTKLYDYAQQHSKIFCLADQFLINSVVKDKVLLLDYKYNVQIQQHFEPIQFLDFPKYNEGIKHPVIIHFIFGKPWEFFKCLHPFRYYWWEIARTYPYYEEVLNTYIKKDLLKTTQSLTPVINTQLIRDALHYTQNKLKYWRYKLLSKITLGKKRKKYKQKRKDLKSRLKQVRRFLKGK